MMYPRLALLREFLREDGAIFVSIDDNEVGHLRLLLDEIFGRRNFVVNIAWQKRTSPDMRLAFSDALEHILVYAKASESIKFNKVPKTQTQRAQFRNPDNDPRGPWVSSDFTAQGYRPNQMYTIRTPGGTEFVPPAGVCWKTIESVFLELVRDNRIWFGRTGRSMPRRKTFLSESPGNTPWSWWPNDDVGHTQEAKKEMGRFCNSEQVFDTPKPVRLIRRVMEIASDKDSIILDSFAGSGTTGHAVLDLNKADGGNRRFVLVEMEPSVAHDITSLRLSRVINGFTYTSGTEATVFEALGGGLSYCTLSDPLFDAEGNIAASVRFPDLARHIFFTETGAPIPKRTTGRSPLLGVHQGKAVYLLFNGIMGDKRPNGGNVLTADCLKKLPPHDGPRVIYAEGTRLSPQRLKREGVIFKQIPYEIKVS
jgi:site-specific DNA-methyltransferase (adenine-specific)/adenine-specific DNA-methyltransferase